MPAWLSGGLAASSDLSRNWPSPHFGQASTAGRVAIALSSAARRFSSASIRVGAACISFQPFTRSRAFNMSPKSATETSPFVAWTIDGSTVGRLVGMLEEVLHRDDAEVCAAIALADGFGVAFNLRGNFMAHRSTVQRQASDRQRHKKNEVGAYYAFSIEKWEWNYSFSLGSEKWTPGQAYSDRRYLQVSGVLSHPHRSSGRRIEVTFLPKKDLSLSYGQHRPDNVGSMTWSRNTAAFNGVASIAEDALPCIIPMLIAGRLRHVLMEGNSPFRGSLSFQRYGFVEELTADDFPEGQW
jgi:hypothetical protein